MLAVITASLAPCLCKIQVEIGDYKDKNDLNEKIMDIRRTPANYTEHENRTSQIDLTRAVKTMRVMFRADQHFAGKSLKRVVTVIVTAWNIFLHIPVPMRLHETTH